MHLVPGNINQRVMSTCHPSSTPIPMLTANFTKDIVIQSKVCSCLRCCEVAVSWCFILLSNSREIFDHISAEYGNCVPRTEQKAKY